MGTKQHWANHLYPHSGTCANCGRERDDLFWHKQDKALYCADIFRCEARLDIQVERKLEELS